MRAVLTILCALFLAGCDTGIREMGPNEIGVIFRKLPPLVGGGVSRAVIGRGEKRVVFPWDQVYRFSTMPRFITWGAGKGHDTIFARAKDGNEVALTITIAYQITGDPEKASRLVQELATTDVAVDALIVSAARADIRTYMNELETLEYRQSKLRNEATDKIKASLNGRFRPFGIQTIAVNLDDFQFKRLNADGSEDSTYQKMIDQIQAKTEDTKRKVAEKDTVRASKGADLAVMEARRISLLREAEGYKKAAVFRGDAYLETQSNQAKGILALGKAEVEGLTQQIQALSGPGGAALLKLEITKQILKSDPRFVLMTDSKQNTIEVKQVDANQLLNQLGVLGALKKEKPGEPEVR